MGNGIAHTFAQCGYLVNLVDVNEVALQKAIATITKNLDRQVQKGIISEEILHYYSGYIGYTEGASVFTLAYIKQVQGMNCTGGICRIEPAFSGVRFTLSTSF